MKKKENLPYRIFELACSMFLHKFRHSGLEAFFCSQMNKHPNDLSIPPGLTKYSWVATRCFLKPGSTIRFAHSSPVHLNGRWDAREDARFFLDWMDELIAQTRTDAQRFQTPAERDAILALYQQARDFYEKKAH